MAEFVDLVRDVERAREAGLSFDPTIARTDTRRPSPRSSPRPPPARAEKHAAPPAPPAQAELYNAAERRWETRQGVPAPDPVLTRRHLLPGGPAGPAQQARTAHRRQQLHPALHPAYQYQPQPKARAHAHGAISQERDGLRHPALWLSPAHFGLMPA